MTKEKISVDVLCFSKAGSQNVNWPHGRFDFLYPQGERDKLEKINAWAQKSNAAYFMFCDSPETIPPFDVLKNIIECGVDFAHQGLMERMGAEYKDLCMLGVSWDKLNAPAGIVSTSWRMNLRHCLLKRQAFREIGGLDTVFETLTGAGLELAFRALKRGLITEHRPGLFAHPGQEFIFEKSSAYDFYCFVFRHYGNIWSGYLLIRRLFKTLNWVAEIAAYLKARKAVGGASAPRGAEDAVRSSVFVFTSDATPAEVSVIIPTLARYEYISAAIDSILRQSMPPKEIIVVDQTPVESRRPEIYSVYEKLRVIWQEQPGQSLARNTALAAAACEYVLMFDDDSVARPDLIEQHLKALQSGRVQVSTGVSLPPPPVVYDLPYEYKYPRLAQTFDTGNSMMRLDLLRSMGGLDRNFDFGPGADADLGTRLYLAGHRILHNPKAVRVHYKAPSGGLRLHGAHKYNTDSGLTKPFPPVTQTYYSLKYMNAAQQREFAWLAYVTAKFPANVRRNPSLRTLAAFSEFFAGLLFLPGRYYFSKRLAVKMLKKTELQCL